ncbi:siderophore-interacting protein [Antribacter gilvus]|uniref:siderophore-interacting protein n=1 Tax=Antribacter gilvus TaxID=2304675 RepID=UPI000F773A95|nr:siderophore-interacting protein [Antribacter gilvus]
MTENPAGEARRRKGVPTTATVRRARHVTPHMIRVTLGGPALAVLDPLPFTDRYVKLVLGELEDGRPLLRTYTVRAVRGTGEAVEWDVDVVVHGTDGALEGVGGPWAAGARPGDEVTFLGPGGDYAPGADAPWHLLMGDESALPAVAAALEALPGGAVARAFVEVADAAERQELTTHGDVLVTWVHRQDGGDLAATVRAAHAAGDLPAGAPQVFLHGEAACVRGLRRWVRTDLGVPRERLSASGYWRRGRTDEGWRAEKQDWKAAVERDDLALVAAH